MFWLIAIDFSHKSPYFSLLSPTSPCELSEREVTSPSNLKVVRALDNYSLVFVIFINFCGQLKDWVGQVLFLVSCPKGQVEKYVNVEACRVLSTSTCDLEECLTLIPYAMCNIYILYHVYRLLVVTSKPNFYFQARLVNNYMYYISIKFCICLLIQDQGYLISD
jgi:hypothetical protein